MKQATTIRIDQRCMEYARKKGNVSLYVNRLISLDIAKASEGTIIDELLKRLLENETFVSEVSSRIGKKAVTARTFPGEPVYDSAGNQAPKGF